MNVMLVHKIWHVKGGVERVLFNLQAALQDRGHTAIPFACAHPDNVPSPYMDLFPPYRDLSSPRPGNGSLTAAANIIYSREARRSLSRVLDEVHVDVAHCRNIYHHLSPSVLLEFKRRCIPVVMQVADYKLICPNYRLFQHGHICEECKGGTYWRALANRCLKDSSMASALVAIEAYVNQMTKVYDRCIDRFIAPSEFCRTKMVEFGLPAERIEVVKHFVDASKWTMASPDDIPAGRPYVLSFGRLTDEKGVDVLVRAMGLLPGVDLVIAGDGPERASLERLAAESGLDNVRFVGFRDGDELRALVRGSRAVVIPSVWYEVFGVTIIEAFAAGKPVIGSRVGAIPELVLDGETGYTFDLGDHDELASLIDKIVSDPASTRSMGLNARRLAEDKHSPEMNLSAIMRIYDTAIGSAKGKA